MTLRNQKKNTKLKTNEFQPKNWFQHKFRLIGVIHLLPLPGSPGFNGLISDIINRAVQDAKYLTSAGIDAVIIENFGDKPFRRYTIHRETLTAFTVVAYEVRNVLNNIPLGINVLRNGGVDALRIAFTVSAEFIRVNIPIGISVTPEGLVNGIATEIAKMRSVLGNNVKLFEDVFVKHSWQIHPISIEDIAVETVSRGMADVIILTGSKTGEPPDPEQVSKIKQVSSVPVLVGSGISPNNIDKYIDICDGAIVGTWLKSDGVIMNPVDPTRVHQLVSKVSNKWKR